MLANQGGLEPFFDQPLARPGDRVDTGLQRRRDLAVAPPLTTVRGVGFQQDPGLQQLLCWMVSAMDKGGEMLSLLIAQCHYVFLYRDLFPGHQSAPSAATEPTNQTNTAESMTGATSLVDDLAQARHIVGPHRGYVPHSPRQIRSAAARASSTGPSETCIEPTEEARSYAAMRVRSSLSRPSSVSSSQRTNSPMCRRFSSR